MVPRVDLSKSSIRLTLSKYIFFYILGGEELSIYDCNSLQSGESVDSGLPKSHKRTDSSVSNTSGQANNPLRQSSNSPSNNLTEYSRMNSESTAQLSAQITEFHIMKANVVKPFAMYSIEV